MIKVYAAGAMLVNFERPEQGFVINQRLWTLFAKFEDAEKAILQNHGDFFECDYNAALIEEHYVIDYSKPPKKGEEIHWIPRQWWYKAIRTDFRRDPIVTKIETPECVNRTCNFWVG